MARCFVCGVSDDKAELLEVISDKGIDKICENCLIRENLPVIRRNKSVQPEVRENVYKRYSRVSGTASGTRTFDKSGNLMKQEESLRSLVDKNYMKNLPGEKGEYPNLIENFHWILMRVRRAKHLTQKQLADAISEPEAAIKMAEQGILPANGERLIQKIERHLNINLSKGENQLFRQNSVQVIPKDKLDLNEDFDIGLLKDEQLKISDLKEIKQKKERRFFWSRKPKEETLGEGGSMKEGKNVEEDLSDEDIDEMFKDG